MRTYLVVALTFSAIAIYGSLVPLNYQSVPWDEAVQRFWNLPYYQLGIGHRADWVANILLFIPLGFAWLGWRRVDRVDGPRTSLSAALVLIGCFLLSLAVEFAQLWFPPRTTSLNDIVAESIGAGVGIVLWLFCGQATTDWLRGFTYRSGPKRQADWLLEAYFVGFLIYCVMPLDLTISLSELAHKYDLGRISLVPLAELSVDWDSAYRVFRQVVLFVPVGGLVATWRRPTRRPVRDWLPALAWTTGIAVAIEAAQLLVYSRYCSSTDVLLGAAGGAIGIALAHRWRPNDPKLATSTGRRRHTWLWLGLAAGYSLGLVFVSCIPFELLRDRLQVRERLEGLFRAPFSALYWGTEFNALTQLLSKLLYFAPLGFLATRWILSLDLNQPRRRLLVILTLAAVSGVALAIEVLQALFPPHVPDSTDILIATSGAALAQFLTLRLMGERYNGRV